VNTASPRLVRFLVGVQHRPATTMIAVNVVLMGAGVAAVACSSHDWGTVAWLTFVACAATATAEALSHARSLWSRVAVVGIGTGATLPLARAAFGLESIDTDAWPTVLSLVAAAVALPHAMVAVASRFDRLALSVWRVAFTSGAAGLFLAGGLMEKSPATIRVRISCFVGWLVATELAFHAAAASTIRMRWILAEIAVASCVCVAVLVRASGDNRPLDSAYAISLGIGWMLGALLVPVARLGRSFTAVPLDHPIHTDFGRPDTR
jgi:hypothetical protein